MARKGDENTLKELEKSLTDAIHVQKTASTNSADLTSVHSSLLELLEVRKANKELVQRQQSSEFVEISHDSSTKLEFIAQKKAIPRLLLYWDPLSAPSQAVYIFLCINHLDFEERVIDRGKVGNIGEHYLKISPLNAEPVIVHDGFTLNQAHAIMCYLATKFRVRSHWYPTQLQLRAVCLSWLDFASEMYKDGISYYVYPQAFLGHKHQDSEVNEDRITTGKQDLIASLTVLERHLEKNKFVLGNAISIADISIVCLLRSVELVGDPANLGFKNVGQYIADVLIYFGEDLRKKAFHGHRHTVHKIRTNKL